MEIRQLKFFCAAAEEKSISAAARKLHLAQPPVSRQIAQLEQEIGVRLFRRGNRGIALTEAGESLYQQAQQLIISMEETVRSVRSLDAGVRGSVHIGMFYSTVPYALPFVKAYHEAYPQVELYIRLGSPQELVSDLNRGELHVLFLRSASREPTGLQERILGSDDLGLIMKAETDPAPESDTVPIDALRNVPMCLLRSDDLWGYSETLLSECQRCGFSPNIICQCYDTPMALQLVLSGFGISYLPVSIIEAHPGSEIYAKQIRGLSATSFAILAWSKTGYYPGSVERFIKFDPHRP